LEFGQIEWLFRVVALFEFDLQIIAQETSCVATGSSGRFPEQACFLHVNSGKAPPTTPGNASTRCCFWARSTRPLNLSVQYPRPSAAKFRWRSKARLPVPRTAAEGE